MWCCGRAAVARLPECGHKEPRPLVCARPLRHLPRTISASRSGNRDKITTAPRGQENAMGKKLFVGNLSFDTTSEELQTLFSEVGTCESANVVTDRDTGRSRE